MATTAALSSGRGYLLKAALYIMAYVIPAAVVWGIIGLCFGCLGNIPLLMPLLACVYALWFGGHEALGLSGRVPGLDWQVPSGWVKRRSAPLQALIWGTTLGPGLLTRNPYAGIWLLPLLLALHHTLWGTLVVGMAIGAAHGCARALGVLSNRKLLDDKAEHIHLLILGAQLRWQYLDGLALLLAAGAMVAYMLSVGGYISPKSALSKRKWGNNGSAIVAPFSFAYAFS